MKTRTLLTLVCALLALTGLVAFFRYALMMTFGGGFAAATDAGGIFREASAELAASGMAFGFIACTLAVWQMRRMLSKLAASPFSQRQRGLELPSVARSSGELVS